MSQREYFVLKCSLSVLAVVLASLLVAVLEAIR